MKKSLGILAALLGFGFVASAQRSLTLSWERFNSQKIDLHQVGVVAPCGDGASWSIGCECLDRNYGNFAAYKDSLHLLGFRYARIQSGWGRTEVKKGKYDFAWLDPIVDGIIDEGLKPWMTLCYGNKLYTKGAVELNQKIFSDEATMTAWCNYVKAVVKRYKGKIVAWEVWNEPRPADLENYINLLIHTSDAIRSVDSSAYVIGFASTGSQSFRDITILPGLKLLAEKGRLDVINAITYHAYYEIPEWGRVVAEYVKEVVRSFSEDIEVIQGEAGCPSKFHFAHGLGQIEWTEYSQAKWVMRRMATDFSLGMKSNLFTFVDLDYNNPDSKEDFAHMQQSYGFLCTNNAGIPVYKRPSLYGARNMVSILDGLHAVEGGYKAYTAEEFSLYRLADASGKIVGAMMWYSGARPSDSLEKVPTNVTIEGLDIPYKRSIVYVEPITGKVFAADGLTTKEGKAFGSLRLTQVPLWDSPVFIFTKDYFEGKIK